jgi:hypothetical protein
MGMSESAFFHSVRKSRSEGILCQLPSADGARSDRQDGHQRDETFRHHQQFGARGHGHGFGGTEGSSGAKGKEQVVDKTVARAAVPRRPRLRGESANRASVARRSRATQPRLGRSTSKRSRTSLCSTPQRNAGVEKLKAGKAEWRLHHRLEEVFQVKDDAKTGGREKDGDGGILQLEPALFRGSQMHSQHWHDERSQ